MHFARATLPNGDSCVVDAHGKPLGNSDADRPIFHILPKLFVLPQLIRPHRGEGLRPKDITLQIETTLPGGLLPEGGIVIRQPYPNNRYFVAGSTMIRNGWIMPLPQGVDRFEVQLRWCIESECLRPHYGATRMEMIHRIIIQLLEGSGRTYSMDANNWPHVDGPTFARSPISVLHIDGDHTEDDFTRGRHITRHGAQGNPEASGRAEFIIDESVAIPGVPLAKAWSIDAHQAEQLHEVRQSTKIIGDADSHLANGAQVMPAKIFIEAVALARRIPAGPRSKFRRSVADVAAGMEQHPAMKMLCDWWDSVQPAGEPMRAGSAMPLVRVRDDGEYWWGYYEIPNCQVAGFNPTGANAARIGDLILVLFTAKQEHATFGEGDFGMQLYHPNGDEASLIGCSKADYLAGEQDEAWFALRALQDFPDRFPAAWDQLLSNGRW
ncbi:hypothetical protein [Dyella ginsengisoli]|uniref:hypothetical protein n=1 Tax=Dyella ginsengisoli TaxID=363848 RepID=UPI00034AC953|nr:hypothetical protein [Dyella ginsengisoli]